MFWHFLSRQLKKKKKGDNTIVNQHPEPKSARFQGHWGPKS